MAFTFGSHPACHHASWTFRLLPQIIVLNYKNLKFRIFGKNFCLTYKGWVIYTYKIVWEDISNMNINFLFKKNKLHYDIALYHYFISLSVTIINFIEVLQLVHFFFIS